MDNFHQQIPQPQASEPKQQPVQPPPATPQPSPFNRRLLTVIFVGILLIIAIGTGGYLLGIRQNQTITTVPQTLPTQPPSSPTPDQAVNWKTYINTSNKFSIKYPQDWKVTEKQIPNTNVVATFTEQRERSQAGAGYSVEIDIRDNPMSLDAKGWAEVEVQLTGGQAEALRFKEVTVGGAKTFLVTGPLPRWTQEVVYVPYNKKIYIIRLSNNVGDASVAKSLTETFHQILSTFKFTQ